MEGVGRCSLRSSPATIATSAPLKTPGQYGERAPTSTRRPCRAYYSLLASFFFFCSYKTPREYHARDLYYGSKGGIDVGIPETR